MAGEAIQVEGLAEFVAELRTLEKPSAWVRQLRDASFQVAELATAAAKSNASTAPEQRVAGTITPIRQTAGAALRFGAGVPFSAGTEFGAHRNVPRVVHEGRTLRIRGARARALNGAIASGAVFAGAPGVRIIRGWNQFRPWLGAGDEAGYFIWPAIRSKTTQIIDTYGKATDQIMSKAFPS